MDPKLLNILRCPNCKNKLTCDDQQLNEKGAIITGILVCTGCPKNYPIIRSIPRFVEMNNYATSFGYQWNLYKYTQVDGYSNISHSEQRFYSETGWSKENMQGNWILDVGCGNGRFLEICARSDCEIVGVDISAAIDAAGELFQKKENIHLVQASIYELPFVQEAFDKCYCIGVIQHTPNVMESVRVLPQFLKTGGKIALTIYEKKPWTRFNSKYLFRSLTKKIDEKYLLKLIKIAGPFLFIVTEILFRIPILNHLFKFIIPFANYNNMKELSLKQRYEWAILDTFDMLSPIYDRPMTENEVRACLEKTGIKEIRRLANSGLNIVAVK